MTRHESGRKGGTTSGEARTLAAVQRARGRALDALDGVGEPLRSRLAALVSAGELDGWLQEIERVNYRRGYCVRDEKLRRDTEAAERASGIAAAREAYAKYGDGVTA
jgi:hypothetical protein